MNSRTAKWVFMLIIVVMGLAAYSNTFHVPFQWDDNSLIKGNPIIWNLDYFIHPSEASGQTFFPQLIRRYVSYLSFTLNYHIHGFSSPGWHAVNITIHIANALLCFALVLGLFKTPLLKDSALSKSSQTVAFFCALYFVVHPMQTMAVTYIYQRMASLVALFCLASILAYLHSRIAESSKKRYLLYGACLFCAILAMKTKENAVTLPIVIVAMEMMFFSGPLKRRLLWIAPVFMTTVIIPASAVVTGYEYDAQEGSSDILGISEFVKYSLGGLFVQCKTLVKYVRLYAFPAGQSLLHDAPDVRSFFEIGVIFSLTFLCSLAGIAVWLFARERKRRPEMVVISFGIAWFFITHSVESSIFYLPIAVQEYRSYLPSVGMFLAIVTFAVITISNLSRQTARRTALSAMAIVAIIFAFATHERNKVWATPMSLWQDVVLKAPMTPMGYINLGLAHMEKGDSEEAISLYSKAIELDPDSGKAHTNIGGLLMARGDLDEAARHFRIAIETSPELAGPHSNLGAIHSSRGEYETALKYLNQSVKLHPDYASGWFNLGLVYHRTNSLDDAIENYNKALAIDGTLDEAQSNLGAIYLAQEDYDKAIEHLAEAARLQPSSAEVHFDLAYALYLAGRPEEAKAEAQRSLSIDPNSPRAGRLLRHLNELEQ